MIDPSRRPWVIAHRGVWTDAPENSLEAFREARRLGADAVELDVRRSADGRLLVHHDPDIDGQAIVDHTAAWAEAQRPSIPTLPDALDACEGMWVDIEVKNSPLEPDWDPSNYAAAEVGRLVSGRDDVMVTSFNPAALVAVAETAPDVTLGLLMDGVADPVALQPPAGTACLLPSHRLVAGPALEDWIERCRRESWWLIPWGVDDRPAIERLVGRGVDGVITDATVVARSVVDDRHG